MMLKFCRNLEFQTDAINSIVRLFEGNELEKSNQWGIAENWTIPNKLEISEETVLFNLNKIQDHNGIPKSNKLSGMNFSVEMETGTGKTYVYLRTILELNLKYGFKKFMIVVPSIAIREGVIKNLDITKKHFSRIYDNIQYRYYEYDSKNVSQIKQFARGMFIEIMVITVSSFNKDTNIMNQKIDKLQGNRPIDLIKETRPILILDEPQNMESDLSKASLKKLEPLFTLRYSATHKNPYSRTYRLNPVDALRKGLVKRIEVSSVTDQDNYNDAYLQCTSIKPSPRSIRAKITVNKKFAVDMKQATITVKIGDDIKQKTSNPAYDGYVISAMNAQHNFIEFSNGKKIKIGEKYGTDRIQMMKMQIKNAIDIHLKKDQDLRSSGIKPITLFFIDKVDNYKLKDGFIRQEFEKMFNLLKKSYKNYDGIDAKDVHRGYFSTKSTEQAIKSDKEAYELIMRNKEELLSMENKIQFVFSHSALREGWDNPNVFTICTLNPTSSIMKKRQEIGRGMRLPVNKNGERVIGKGHVLTVVANEKYDEYAKKLQAEYEEDGDYDQALNPANRKESKTISPKKKDMLNPEFVKLWDKISKKTKYHIKLDSTKLIKKCIDKINNIDVQVPNVVIETARIDLEEGGKVAHKLIDIKTGYAGDTNYSYPVPDIINHITKETNLTRTTVLKILCGTRNLSQVFNNPQKFTALCIDIIKDNLRDLLIEGIEYVEENDWYKMKLFGDIETYKNEIIQVKKSIYDYIVYESEAEKKFAEDMDVRNDIRLFVKLPSWFVVETPIGRYNPDWAIVKDENGNIGNVYLIIETKKFTNLDELRVKELKKIKCGEKHFDAIKVNYKTVKRSQDV